MSQETEQHDKEMESKLRSIFTNKELQAKIVDTVIHDRPLGWSRRSSSPYYKEEYALQFKKVLDAIASTGKPFCYRYEWFRENFQIGKDTLYLRIYQGKRFLLERMDPDHYYEKLLDKIDITRERGVGVLVKLKIEATPGGPVFEPEEVMPESEGPKWRKRMQEWLEDSDSTTSFKQEGLILSPAEIEALRTQLGALSNVMPSVTSHSVKLLKMNLKAIEE